MGKLQLNIEQVLQAARAAGANDAVLEGLRQRLEVLNEPPSQLCDLDGTRALKVLSRQLASCFEPYSVDGMAIAAPTPEERDAAIAATRAALHAATEFPTWVLLGRWDMAAKFLASLELRPDPERGMDDHQLLHNEQLRAVVEFMRGQKSNYPHKTGQWIGFYNACRVASVLACPLQGQGCEENFDCWETRWGFCRMDLEAKR